MLWLLGACGGEAADEPLPPDLGMVKSFEVPSKRHVNGEVRYAQTPPVGGDHSPDLQRCGFYPSRVAPEKAVHSMEHGAVWVTYRPTAPSGDVDTLRDLTRRHRHLLVSEWDRRLPAPVVASAWARQMTLASASDPRLEEFIKEFASGSQAPERGAYC
jgi:hypothetical protein